MAKPTKAQVKELFDIHMGPIVQSERLQRSYGFDNTRSWIDPNGYRLSDRVWRQRLAIRHQIDQILRQAIADGTDALVVADALEAYLLPGLKPVRGVAGDLLPGQARRIVTSMPNIREVLDSTRPFMGSYPARRLARTEITRAHGAATIWAAERTPFAVGVKWSLSGRHPKSDPCDQKASRNEGLGPGVYPPKNVPRYPEHPQCLCNLSTVTVKDDKAIVDQLRAKYGLGDVVPTADAVSVLRAFELPPEPNDLMRKVFSIRGDVDVRAVAQDGLRAIDSVHKDGVLPRIPVNTDFDQFSKTAAHFRFKGGQPVEIGVNSLKQFKSTAHESFVHEVGHFLDLSGVGTPGAFASATDPLLEPWRIAVRDSGATQQLQNELSLGVRKIPMPDGTVRDYPIDKKYVTYLLDSNEAWARSYSQYIARKSKDPDLLRALEETRQSSMYPTAWTDADFAPIEAAIDDLFRALGWIQ